MSDNIAKVDAWLDEVPEGAKLSRFEYFSRLAARNGFRTTVSSWGVQRSGGPFGDLWGLEENEGLALMQFSGWLEGVYVVDGAAYDYVLSRVMAYWKRHCPEFKNGGDDGTETV